MEDVRLFCMAATRPSCPFCDDFDARARTRLRTCVRTVMIMYAQDLQRRRAMARPVRTTVGEPRPHGLPLLRATTLHAARGPELERRIRGRDGALGWD